MNSKAQLSLYLLIIIIVLIAISSIFIKEISKIEALKEDINSKYISKETKELSTILNSAKKSTISGAISNVYIIDSDINIKDHYG